MSNPEIAEAMEASDRFIMDDKAYREYLQRESAILDYNNGMAGSREEGRKEGREEGKHENIAQVVGMTVDEVARIAQEK